MITERMAPATDCLECASELSASEMHIGHHTACKGGGTKQRNTSRNYISYPVGHEELTLFKADGNYILI